MGQVRNGIPEVEERLEECAGDFIIEEWSHADQYDEKLLQRRRITQFQPIPLIGRF